MNPFRTILATCLCATAMAWRAHGQDTPPVPQTPQRVGRPLPISLPPHPPINLEFPGGTAVDFINAVGKAAHGINIVTMADLSDIAVPAMTLKNVDPRAAIDTLRSLPSQQPGRTVEVFVREEGPRSAEQLPVIIVGAQVIPHRSGGGASEGLLTIVISISEVLDERVKADDVLTAVQTALQMSESKAQPVQVRFHESTGLLIARGNGEQISAINNVVKQLRERATQVEARQQRNDAALAECRSKLEDASHQMVEWKTRSEILQQDLERSKESLAEREALLRHYMSLAGNRPESKKPETPNPSRPN